jgi:hypothetical protein
MTNHPLLAIITLFCENPTATHWLLVLYLIYYDIRRIRTWLIDLILAYAHDQVED